MKMYHYTLVFTLEAKLYAIIYSELYQKCCSSNRIIHTAIQINCIKIWRNHMVPRLII
jgi:hypothetical protein